MSKPHTVEEARHILLKRLAGCVDYWERESRAESTREKMEGLLFSMLVVLDGGVADIPGYALIPLPHPTDQSYHEKRDENYYPMTELPENAFDIGGSLHEKISEYYER